ncbi:MAG: AmmeMemoRadiSam system protein A [Lachnospiraceae bacterium]|nr:AmmeMemoRadiSam system protein A [Lachnospiraceae bacterium]
MAGALDGVDVEATQLSHEDVTGVGYGICTFYPKDGAESGEAEKTSAGIAATEEKSSGIAATEEKSAGIATTEEKSVDTAVPGKNGIVTAINENRQFLRIRQAHEEKELNEKREKSDAYVKLARASAEYYVRNRKIMELPEGLPDELLSIRSGAFVSIHKHDRLRGCIGTFLPTKKTLAEEIIQNAVSAVSDDPRFDPVEEKELKWLDINVDVLSTPEQIESKDDLDVKKYGVIVQCGHRRGLLLPDLDGVDTVEQQLSIAMRKGNIAPGSKVDLYRFEVVRHR